MTDMVFVVCLDILFISFQSVVVLNFFPLLRLKAAVVFVNKSITIPKVDGSILNLKSWSYIHINFIPISHLDFADFDFALAGPMVCLCTWSESSMRSLGILGFVLQITSVTERLLQTWMIDFPMQRLKNSIRAYMLGQLVVSFMLPVLLYWLLKIPSMQL